MSTPRRAPQHTHVRDLFEIRNLGVEGLQRLLQIRHDTVAQIAHHHVHGEITTLVTVIGGPNSIAQLIVDNAMPQEPYHFWYRFLISIAEGVMYLQSLVPDGSRHFGYLSSSTISIYDGNRPFIKCLGRVLPPDQLEPVHLAYVAPEVYTGRFPVSERSDVYSFGVIMHEIFTQRLIFSDSGLMRGRGAANPRWLGAVGRSSIAQPVFSSSAVCA